ncbi:MAG: amidohydrolase [Clostridiales bacterium]|nr:amidohydrolase [Clostridiales bacterium]
MPIADFVIESDAVYTGLADAPAKGCVAVKGNKIIAVCGSDEVRSFVGAETKTCSFGNNLVMPGFIDAHTHFCIGAGLMSENYVDLSSCKSAEECALLIKDHYDRHPGLGHILGWGWFLMHWDIKANPDKTVLDRYVPDIPVYTFSVDGHTSWLNSKALEACGFTPETPVRYGEIQVGADGGLTGILMENEAQTKPNENAFLCTEEDYEKMFAYAARSGITSLTDLSVAPKLGQEPKAYGMLASLKAAGRLTARMHLYPSLGDDGNFTVAWGIREKYQAPDLMFGGLKQFVDGTTSQYTSPLLEPYSDRPEETGWSYYPEEYYMEVVPKANREGFSLKVHAIGDKAVRMILDAYEASYRQNDLSGVRNCVEHIESIHPSDIERFKELGVIASVQPAHLPLDAGEKAIRIGEERARYQWPFKSLLDAGATLAFGTDYPVYLLDPMHGIHAAVTRSYLDGAPVGSDHGESIPLKSALDAYTKGSAFSLNREDEIGTLEAGKLADIVVLSGNLFDMEPQGYLEVEPLLTVMDGKVVYEKEARL